MIGSHGWKSLASATLASALLILAAALLALPGSPGDWPQGLQEAIQKPVVLVPAGALFLTGLLWCIRTWVFQIRLLEPGPILVAGIEDATLPQGPAPAVAVGMDAEDGPGPAPVMRLGMYLRQRLAELEFTAPIPMPGRPPSSDFVELLGTTKLDFKQPLAVVGKLLRLVLPTHAYEVRATLMCREVEPCLGVAVELTVLPRRTTAFRTYWADSWDAVLDRATSGIGARVVALSRRSQRGPWAGWHRRELDEELFDAYQRFCRLSREHRYEEAMAALYAALRLDPTNNHLRYELGLLQEELALYLDALLTYHSVRRGTKERIKATTDKRELVALERLELLARYRAAFVLGFGERLAHQWLPAPHARSMAKRALELRELRERLRPILLERYGDLKISSQDRAVLGLGGATRQGLTELLVEKPHRLEGASELEPDGPPRDEGADPRAISDREIKRRRRARERSRADLRRVRLMQLRLVFQLFAVHDVTRFMQEYENRDIDRLDAGISRLAVRLLPAWAQVRADWARHLLWGQARRCRSHPATETDGPPESAWPPKPKKILARWERERVGSQDARTALGESKLFIDHYNAACTFAIGLLQERHVDQRPAGDRVRKLAAAAVEQLEAATRVAGSAQIASRWDWILIEDPDLAGLRAEPEFRRFESERFPSAGPLPVRPSNIVDLVAGRHSARLAQECGARLEAEWHARAQREGATDAHEALEWWHEELQAWDLARQLSLHHRHWQTRLEIIRTMQRFCTRHGLAEFAVPQRGYSVDPIDAAPESIDRAGRRELSYADERIGALEREFRSAEPEATFEAWHGYLQRLDSHGEGLDEELRRRLATNRAAAWGELRIAFAHWLRDADDLEAAKAAVARAARTLDELPPPGLHPAELSGAAPLEAGHGGRRLSSASG